ncbi:MAG: hypothetical protein IKL11_02870 [Muribaculaceae bacterium]|nr:hypothetical protein [Muribaculaceae bacterium]MBR3766089.1 hypothetical protein [Muribaculaceae bacterium]
MTLTGIIIIAIVVVAIVLIAMYFSYNNKEIALRKEVEAQRGKIESVHDKMWKVIKQKANVTEQYRDMFEKVYPDIIAGRYSGEGAMAMKWIQEANPEIDASLYKDVMQAIEIQREHFHSAQTRMLDVIRERATLIESYPSRWFISNKSEIEYEVVSSTRSKTVMDTGLDDEIEIFEKR